MKKLFILLLLAFIMTSSSCSLGGIILGKRGNFFQDDEAMANNSFEKVLEAIKNQDRVALKSLFSKKAFIEAENFDESIVLLFEFFNGDFISYDDWGGPTGGGLREDGKERYYLQSTYDVKTSEQIYRFAKQEFTVNEFDPDSVGISSLYVIKMEDTDEQFAYWGDRKWTPGIVIEKTRE